MDFFEKKPPSPPPKKKKLSLYYLLDFCTNSISGKNLVFDMDQNALDQSDWKILILNISLEQNDKIT